MTISDDAFHAQPVAAVKTDHQSTMRISTRRGPILSPSQPPGISNTAYAHPKAANAHPIWMVVNPRSLLMYKAETLIAARST
jgi:hypothetical protein